MTQLSLIEDSDRPEHPLDVVERLASLRDWIFDRIETDEMSVSVSGRWAEYHVAFTWIEEVESLHVAGQHRRAVDLMLEGDDVADPDLALTLVMLERHSIRRIATLDERFAAFDLEVVSAESAP